jgi:hypothetical protein
MRGSSALQPVCLLKNHQDKHRQGVELKSIMPANIKHIINLACQKKNLYYGQICISTLVPNFFARK